jgi:Flagellar biosynthesis protein, FliO
MIRGRQEFRSGRRPADPSRLALAVWTGLFFATAAARPALADATGETARSSGGVDHGSGSSDEHSRPPARSRAPRPSGPSWLRGDPGGDHWGAGTAVLALVLAVGGGVAVAARRMGPRGPAGAIQVVGRVALSPKHSVYLLRVGRRVLVVGAGPQGPPALITELADEPHEPPTPQRGAES